MTLLPAGLLILACVLAWSRALWVLGALLYDIADGRGWNLPRIEVRRGPVLTDEDIRRIERTGRLEVGR